MARSNFSRAHRRKFISKLTVARNAVGGICKLIKHVGLEFIFGPSFDELIATAAAKCLIYH